MTRIALGVVFLVAGLVLAGVATLPLLPPPHTAHVALVPLFLGIAMAVFGALLIDWLDSKNALTSLAALAAPYLERFGGKTPPPTGGAS